MELFHTVAATSTRPASGDLAYSALPNAPVLPHADRRGVLARSRTLLSGPRSPRSLVLRRRYRAECSPS